MPHINQLLQAVPIFPHLVHHSPSLHLWYTSAQQMETRFDVIIVGAGPAGLQCARTLKGSNKSVLIVDRKKVIGPKTCGGGLTHQDEGFGIPESLSHPAPTHTIRVGGHDTVIHLKHGLRSITRLDLGQFLLKEISGTANITVLTDTKVTEIQKDSVVTTQGTFGFTSLVGADGADSMVRRFLKLPRKITLGFAIDVPVKTERVLWFFDPARIATGYMWAFPKREGITNVGAYYDPDEIPYEKVIEAFKEFMADEGFPFDPEAVRGAPLGVLYKGALFGNVFLAGDAAGLTEAFTGEGIAFALASGQEVAKRILDPAYPMPELERMLALKQRREGMLKRLRAHPRLQTQMLTLGAKLLKAEKFQKYFGT
ncbi:MAG: geranylgeranyl reductase [Candidatus Peribacter riflensis]|uniref:Geranylgeranyl reductase n=1 Tax=Candidatus Peribacter riflensis TaxID=1735162 RepID=A0A0S1SQV1_9BACT|nr:MAG: geranylgeranyl reductase [Candidatus Peribacter riflensis]ALM11728.1 MAG: geranylgeranyl reductase [Candidatus Peribacter riflensis]ALM12831.1 MAG: geranylgeranyl reductase [Candidatus Peribacter riflensis]